MIEKGKIVGMLFFVAYCQSAHMRLGILAQQFEPIIVTGIAVVKGDLLRCGNCNVCK